MSVIPMFSPALIDVEITAAIGSLRGRFGQTVKFIGAGAVVIDDIPDNVTAVGIPAKVSK